MSQEITYQQETFVGLVEDLSSIHSTYTGVPWSLEGVNALFWALQVPSMRIICMQAKYTQDEESNMKLGKLGR